MEKLVLIIPNITHKIEAINFIKEFREYNSKINGTGALDSHLDNYDGWLKKLENDLDYNNIKPDRVPANTYFAIREKDNKIIGMINIRHKLNDYLLERGGHIGYGVRPTERKKGYATNILSLGLKRCKELGITKVLITCHKDNIGSVKTIQNNNGVLENEIIDDENKKILQRYWVNLDIIN
jgi:predicted acetyltransferase